jgi:hypothetical protein
MLKVTGWRCKIMTFHLCQTTLGSQIASMASHHWQSRRLQDLAKPSESAPWRQVPYPKLVRIANGRNLIVGNDIVKTWVHALLFDPFFWFRYI